MNRTLRELRERLARFDTDLKQAVESECEFHRCVLTFTTSVDSFIVNQMEQDRHLQRLVDDDTRRTRNARNEYEALASNFYLHYPKHPPLASTGKRLSSSSINNNNNSVNNTSHHNSFNNNIDSNAAAVPTDNIDPNNNTDGSTSMPNVNNNNAFVVNQQVRRNDVNIHHNVHNTKAGNAPTTTATTAGGSGVGTTSTTIVAATRRKRQTSRLYNVFRCVVMYSGIVISVVIIAPIHFLFSYISRLFPITASNTNTTARDRITSATSLSNGNKKNNGRSTASDKSSKVGAVTTSYNTLQQQQHRPGYANEQHQHQPLTTTITTQTSISTPTRRQRHDAATTSASQQHARLYHQHDPQRIDGSNTQGGIGTVINNNNVANDNNNKKDDDDDDDGDTFVDAVNTSRGHAATGDFSHSGDYFSVPSQDFNRNDVGGLGSSSSGKQMKSGGEAAQQQQFHMDHTCSEQGLEDWVIPHRSDTASTRYDDDHSPFPPLDFWNISTDDLKLDMLANANSSTPSDSLSRSPANI